MQASPSPAAHAAQHTYEYMMTVIFVHFRRLFLSSPVMPGQRPVMLNYFYISQRASLVSYLLLLVHGAAMSTTGQRQLLARPEAKYANPWPPGHQPGRHQVVFYSSPRECLAVIQVMFHS